MPLARLVAPHLLSADGPTDLESSGSRTCPCRPSRLVRPPLAGGQGKGRHDGLCAPRPKAAELPAFAVVDSDRPCFPVSPDRNSHYILWGHWYSTALKARMPDSRRLHIIRQGGWPAVGGSRELESKAEQPGAFVAPIRGYSSDGGNSCLDVGNAALRAGLRAAEEARLRLPRAAGYRLLPGTTARKAIRERGGNPRSNVP